jgi:hypothetical protein
MYWWGEYTWSSSAVSVQEGVISVEFITQEEGPGTHDWALDTWRQKNRNGELHINIEIIEITRVIYLNQWDPPGSTDQVYGMNPSEQLFLIVQKEPVFKSTVLLQLNRTIDHVR